MTVKQLISLSTYGNEPIEEVKLIVDSMEIRNLLMNKPNYISSLNQLYVSVKDLILDEDLSNLIVFNFGIEGDNSIYINV